MTPRPPRLPSIPTPSPWTRLACTTRAFLPRLRCSTAPASRGPRLQDPRPILVARSCFNHPIVDIWNEKLSMKVVDLLDARTIRFTTVDVVRFKTLEVEEEDAGGDTEVSPVTIWIGVFIGITSATAAHDAAKDILALLAEHQITDVDVDFRGSIYVREVGPELVPPVDDLDPLLDVVSPVTPALGLHISTRARPNAQGTMAVYLAEGGEKNRLLGLSCRHVLISSDEPNTPVTWHRSGPSRDVLVLGERAFNKLVDSIKLKVGGHGIAVERWNQQIEGFKTREAGDDAADARKARSSRIKTERLVADAEEAMEALQTFLEEVNRDWKPIKNRVLGRVLIAPPISLGAGDSDERYTEDWGIFQLDRAKLGPGFQGNVMDLGTSMSPEDFTRKCFPRDDANWSFKFPDNRLLALRGTITNQQMHHPDMFDVNRDPCLLVVKSGNATGTTIGRANGVFSIVREYYNLDMNVHQTSMEWGILGYDKSGAFSKPGDSGSIIADIKGRIGGMLTGGSGKTEFLDMTYATPFWWLLKRIKAGKEFPNVHLSINV